MSPLGNHTTRLVDLEDQPSGGETNWTILLKTGNIGSNGMRPSPNRGALLLLNDDDCVTASALCKVYPNIGSMYFVLLQHTSTRSKSFLGYVKSANTATAYHCNINTNI